MSKKCFSLSKLVGAYGSDISAFAAGFLLIICSHYVGQILYNRKVILLTALLSLEAVKVVNMTMALVAVRQPAGRPCWSNVVIRSTSQVETQCSALLVQAIS